MRGVGKGWLAVSAVLLTVACEPVAPVVPDAPPAPVDDCGASGYQGLVGQPRAVVASMKFPIGTRVIGPDDAVTADYRPDRLNIEYSLGGLIERASCY